MKEMKNWMTIINKLSPLYLNSLSYASNDWRQREDLTVSTPVQRQILPNEIVADFDCVVDGYVDERPKITDYFLKHNYKFALFRSSNTGVHVHFFANAKDKYNKFGILKLIEKDLGVKVDAQVVKRGIIRAENSYHPEKKMEKSLVYSNVSPFSYVNELPVEMLIKASDFKPKRVIRHDSGETPKCIKFIQSNSFSDGRQRLMFVLASWYKSQGVKEEDIYAHIKEWAKRQGMKSSRYNIKSVINSADGSMTCTGRHELLEELGFSSGCY